MEGSEASAKKVESRPSIRWRLAGALRWLPEFRGRDRLSKLLTDGQALPAGVQTGSFGPNLNFSVRYADDGSMLELFFLQYQRPSLASVFEACLAPGACFFDVGANIGIYSAWASRLVTESGQVRAFEPIPSTREFLHQMLDYNAIENVQIEPVAVGNEVGILRIYRPGNASGIASAVHPEGEPFDVEATTLDRYLSDSGCPMPALIKIDVEDFELQVLRGAGELLRQPDAPVVVFETHDHGARSEAFQESAELFRARGYALFGLCPSGLQRIDDANLGPLSMNSLAAHPERHAATLAKLRPLRFPRNQNV